MSGNNYYEVVIVGGGVAGCGTAFQLLTQPNPPSSVLLLEAGSLGYGSNQISEVPSYRSDRDGNESKYVPATSGSAVFRDTPAIKMCVLMFAATMKEFEHHHGMEGVESYLKLAHIGIETEKKLAKMVLPNPEKQLRELGSVYVADESSEAELVEEYHKLRSLGHDVQLLDRAQVEDLHGKAAGFTKGIYFPNDAVIHSAEYARSLASYAARNSGGRLTIREAAPRVVDIVDVPSNNNVLVVLKDGTHIRAGKVVVATGGLFLNKDLAGIIRPCWSYLVSIRDPEAFDSDNKLKQISKDNIAKNPAHPKLALPVRNGMTLPNSPNFFTHGFSHDWCMTDGVMRLSGEDHYSALKAPKAKERVENLARWFYEKYPHVPEDKNRGELYGVYSETPDALPLIGKMRPESNIVYICGCNAWGQAVMSFGTLVVPSILGYGAPLSPEMNKLANFVSPMRFTSVRMINNSSL